MDGGKQEMNTNGRVTIPTDMDAVPETLDLLKRWGADAIRDCDGTEFPQELKDTGAKIYATYYTTRKDNAWAEANPDEVQQCYIMTPFYTAADGALIIPLMTGISRELMKVNDHDDITRWWEVMDRMTGEPVSTADWHYDAASESVIIDAPAAYMSTRSAPGLPDLGPRPHVQLCYQRLEGRGASDPVRCAPAQDPRLHNEASA